MLLARERRQFEILRRDEQQRANRQRRVGIEMQPVKRRVLIVPDVFVKLVVFRVLDLRLVARPQRLDGVDFLPVHLDRQRHEVRVALDDPLDLPSLRKLIVLQMHDDLRPARKVIRRLDLIARLPIALPLPPLLTRTAAPRKNGDLIRDHERRIKAHAKLPDERRIHRAALRLRLELFDERLRSRVCNRPEIFNQLPVRHADARIRERDRLRRLIRREGHLQRRIRLRDFLPARLQKAQFLRGIRRIRNQLADEDLLIRVERMDDKIEELRDLGLELMFLWCSGRTHRAADSMDGADLRKGCVAATRLHRTSATNRARPLFFCPSAHPVAR